MSNRVYFGTTWFLPPFRAHGYWVEDAAGKNVAEAASLELAKALVDMLNSGLKQSTTIPNKSSI
jgi:hypothetical protein